MKRPSFTHACRLACAAPCVVTRGLTAAVGLALRSALLLQICFDDKAEGGCKVTHKRRSNAVVAKDLATIAQALITGKVSMPGSLCAGLLAGCAESGQLGH